MSPLTRIKIMKTTVFVSFFIVSSKYHKEGYYENVYTGSSTCDPDKGCTTNPVDWTFFTEKEIEVELDVPDFDYRLIAAGGLERELEKMRADFSVEESKMKAKISELLALPSLDHE